MKQIKSQMQSLIGKGGEPGKQRNHEEVLRNSDPFKRMNTVNLRETNETTSSNCQNVVVMTQVNKVI